MKQPNNNKQPSALGEIGSEPVARRAAVPALLIALLAAVLFWGDTHVLSHGGGLDPQVYYPFISTNEVASFHIREPEDPRITKGRGLYALVCASCHQPDGLGGVPQGCPPLVGSDWVLSEDPSRIIAIVLKGLTGPINVSGKSYGTGTMLGFEPNLSDEDIASVLSQIRNHWNNKALMVEPSLVKKIRGEVKDHSGNMTVDELKKRYPQAAPN